MPKEKLITFVKDMDNSKEVDYKELLKMLDDSHLYDLAWMQRNGNLGGGNKNNLLKDELLEKVKILVKFNDFIEIKPRTIRMGKIRLDSSYEAYHKEKADLTFSVIEHSDKRRTIFNPLKITSDLGETWYPHNIISIEDPTLLLGNHFHDYDEVFFTPTGRLCFVFVDSEEPQNPKAYQLSAGSRIVIPEGVDHVVKGKKGSVLMGYGTIEFDPKRLIPSSANVKETLRKSLENLIKN